MASENQRLSELSRKIYKQRQERDLALGKRGETDCLPLFREKFDKYLAKTDEYNTMDFISPKTYIELKTRNYRFTQLSDIMIGKNKVEFCMKSNRRCILAWKFIDGVYYYEFNKNDVENGDVYFAMGGRMDRGIDERREVAYIKKHLLLNI